MKNSRLRLHQSLAWLASFALLASQICNLSLSAEEQTSKSITNSLGMKLVLIPAGEFMMGGEVDQADIFKFFSYCDPKMIPDEFPRHRVRISKPFYMGQHEVTMGQFLEFYHDVKNNPEVEPGKKLMWGNGKIGKNLIDLSAPDWKMELDHPAIYISPIDADAFCKWLSKKEGKKYRLPTEAEWEYACRAGTNSHYHFGNDPEDFVHYCNSADASRKETSGSKKVDSFDQEGNKTGTVPFPYISGNDGYDWTAPVGKFKPNDFGLYDMHGNVWEWCSDWYDENYYTSSPEKDPQGPETGKLRVARGGAFNRTPFFLRCAYRAKGNPTRQNIHYGFRVVCEE